MTDPRTIDRRTALKTIGTACVGGSGILTGSAAAKDGGRRKNVVSIEAGHDHDSDDPEWWLDIDRQEIPPGWVTFEFENLTDHLHFGYMIKVSDPALFGHEELMSPGLVDFEPNPGDPGQWGEKWRNAANKPFQYAWDPYHDGEWPVGNALEPEPETLMGELILPGETGTHLPDWFLAPDLAMPVGGPGFTGGSQTATTTQYLDPGVYVLECYVPDEEGRFHSAYGMTEYIAVTDDDEMGREPAADVEVSIHSEEGITFEPETDLKPGRYIVEVIFEDNIPYPNVLGHDVNLLRKDDVDMDDLDYWMDYLDAEDPLDPDSMYMDRGALTSSHHNPGPETFLGGVQDVFAGDGPGFVEDEYPVSTYIEVTLRPGEYAWVAEVADPAGKEMLTEFSVTPPGRRGVGIPIWTKRDHGLEPASGNSPTPSRRRR